MDYKYLQLNIFQQQKEYSKKILFANGKYYADTVVGVSSDDVVAVGASLVGSAVIGAAVDELAAPVAMKPDDGVGSVGRGDNIGNGDSDGDGGKMVAVSPCRAFSVLLTPPTALLTMDCCTFTVEFRRLPVVSMIRCRTSRWLVTAPRISAVVLFNTDDSTADVELSSPLVMPITSTFALPFAVALSPIRTKSCMAPAEELSTVRTNDAVAFNSRLVSISTSPVMLFCMLAKSPINDVEPDSTPFNEFAVVFNRLVVEFNNDTIVFFSWLTTLSSNPDVALITTATEWPVEPTRFVVWLTRCWINCCCPLRIGSITFDVRFTNVPGIVCVDASNFFEMPNKLLIMAELALITPLKTLDVVFSKPLTSAFVVLGTRFDVFCNLLINKLEFPVFGDAVNEGMLGFSTEVNAFDTDDINWLVRSTTWFIRFVAREAAFDRVNDNSSKRPADAGVGAAYTPPCCSTSTEQCHCCQWSPQHDKKETFAEKHKIEIWQINIKEIVGRLWSQARLYAWYLTLTTAIRRIPKITLLFMANRFNYVASKNVLSYSDSRAHTSRTRLFPGQVLEQIEALMS